MHRALLQSIRDALAATGRARVGGDLGTLPCLVLPELVAEPRRPLLWLTADEQRAEACYQALRFAMGDPGTHIHSDARLRVALYPDWDVDAYSGLSPHGEITRRRIEVLAALAEGKPWIIVDRSRGPARASGRGRLPARRSG